jgi:hypothetical protein
MRALALGVFVSLGIFLPTSGDAQRLPLSAPPTVTAEREVWQIVGEPIFYDGDFYFPTNLNIFFDANTIVRTGVYRGIPLYQDRTLEPYSIIYVPIGRGLMRAYERPRVGELASTVGSRTPSFPPQPFTVTGTFGEEQPLFETTLLGDRAGSLRSAPTTGVAAAPREPATATALASAATHMESIPPPKPGPNGIFIEFDRAKWFSAGPVESFSAERFTPIGNYFGWPVYRDVGGSAATIWVPVVADGPVAPYSKR